MKTWVSILVGAGIVLAVLFGISLGRLFPRPVDIPPAKVDTLFVRETIKVTEPVFVTNRVIDSVRIPVTDTIRMCDTLYVMMAQEQIRWEDSLSVVYASGVHPQVDSVIHHTCDRIITRDIPVVKVKKTRWGIGIQVGGGVTYANGTFAFAPYAGVGISYNLFAW